MTARKRTAGFTLIELAVVGAIVAAFVVVGFVVLRDSLGDQRAKAGVRGIADLLALARTEAIRTGDNHIVFFEQDAEDVALSGPYGQPAAALLIRDANANGRIDADEKIAAVNVDDTGSLEWGSTFAAAMGSPERAPDDASTGVFPEPTPGFVCCTFVEPDGDPARWVAFFPDGTPRSFSIIPFAPDIIASGNGGVYVTSGTRDYAVVVAPLGGVRVHAFNNGAEVWTE